MCAKANNASRWLPKRVGLPTGGLTFADYDLNMGGYRINGHITHLLGLPNTEDVQYSALEERIVPEDRERVARERVCGDYKEGLLF